ncbi:hypothetical protein [Urechidicola croceus]|uniref:Uncharacterized protein n=1 Tax=Urechidicola croceus TaxID=1850246 RepID=A0A1D8P7K3_9FLAO|nr:hypothetical protein [Urechidicola croceus]AOW20555.1 hypothetical protein LPB138_07625 [Urechidicola croceus]
MKKIKKPLFILLILISSICYSQEKVTNESILQMMNMGFSDDLIISKINSSDYKFDTSLSELSKLNDAGVSNDIITLMIEKSKHNTISKTGIYFQDGDELKLIQPTVFSGTSNNAVAQKLVSGLINSKTKATLPKSQSNNVLTDSSPEFTFIFDVSSASVDNMQTSPGGNDRFNWWFKVASSPNEFVLLQLKVKEKKNLREVITGKGNVLTSSTGIDPKFALPFDIEEIEGNKYKVTPANLPPGEYAFFYQGQIPGGRSNQSVFDFSVK